MPKHEENDRTRWTRIVYVIELDPAACQDRRSDCDGECGRTPVYVGQSAQSAKDRFAQHRAGHKASRWVKTYGLRVRPDLAGDYGEMETVAASQAAEVELADALRHTGLYCVYGGH